MEEKLDNLKHINLDLKMKQVINSGSFSVLTPSEILVYLGALAHTDIQMNNSYPSQEGIAKKMGLSMNTVRTASKGLEEKGLMIRHNRGLLKTIMYEFPDPDKPLVLPDPEPVEPVAVVETPEPVTQAYNEELIEPLFKEYKTADAFYNDFKQRFLKKYGGEYPSKYRSDIAMIEQYIMGKYTDIELDGILTIVFRDYRRIWANESFPIPTITGVCKFMAQQAQAKFYMEQEERLKRMNFPKEEDIDKYFTKQHEDWME